MGKFETEEQEQTYEALVESGRELLLTYGPRKTNVADVTEPVGIAKSTFYLYFESKADLYLEILTREFEKLNNQIEDEIVDIDGPSERVEVLFQCYREFSEDNPFIQQLLTESNFQKMFRKSVSAERFEEVQREGMANFMPYISSIQDESDGLLSEAEPSTILGVMGVIGLLVLNRDTYEDYDDTYYDDVQNLLIHALAKGLTTPH